MGQLHPITLVQALWFLPPFPFRFSSAASASASASMSASTSRSTSSSGHRSLDDLPPDLIVSICTFLPLADVFAPPLSRSWQAMLGSAASERLWHRAIYPTLLADAKLFRLLLDAIPMDDAERTALAAAESLYREQTEQAAAATVTVPISALQSALPASLRRRFVLAQWERAALVRAWPHDAFQVAVPFRRRGPCYYFGARGIDITWMNGQYWRFEDATDSVFGEMACLRHVWWFAMVTQVRLPRGQYRMRARIGVQRHTNIGRPELRVHPAVEGTATSISRLFATRDELRSLYDRGQVSVFPGTEPDPHHAFRMCDIELGDLIVHGSPKKTAEAPAAATNRDNSGSDHGDHGDDELELIALNVNISDTDGNPKREFALDALVFELVV